MKKKSEDLNDDVEYIEGEDETDLQKLNMLLKRTRENVKKCDKERQDYLTGWQRARADLINERREHAEKAGTLLKVAQEGILRDLLPILDSFDMAFNNKDAWERVDKNWRSGIEYIYSNFLSILEQYDFSIDDPIGKPFDPVRHESIEMVDVEEPSQDNTVIAVLQKGYLQKEVVVRPAKVKVGVYTKKATS
ncbi:MAG TPA: nucleotide exchange factor GrpE [Candidatus Paceibacterota bacterium]